MPFRIALAWLACCSLVAAALPVAAQETEAAPNGLPEGARISVAYRNAPLARVVADIARITGEIYVYDDTLASLGTITVEGPAKVSPGEAVALLDSMLLMRGYAAVPLPAGGRKIVQIGGSEGTWRDPSQLAESDTLTTTLLRLESADAEVVLQVLTPFLGAQNVGQAYPPTNGLILSGPSSLLRRLRTAVEALDRREPTRMLIWRLQHADAERVVDQLLEILDPEVLIDATSDASSNSVLLRLPVTEITRVRALVNRLDRPDRGLGELHVISLQYADPEELAEHLRTLRDGSGSTDAEGAPTGGLLGSAFHVAVDLPTNSLLLQTAPETYNAIVDVVRELDRVPDTVRVEVTVANVQIEEGLDIGLDWLIPSLTDPKKPQDLIATVLSRSSTAGVPAVPGTRTPFVATFTRAPLLVPIVDPVSGTPLLFEVPRESFQVTLNGRRVFTETLLRPQLLVASGEEHMLFAGDNLPIPIGASDQARPTQVRQDIERRDVGTTLRLTPTVGVQGTVELDLQLNVSTLSEAAAGPVEEVGPSLREIDVQSTVRLRRGELAVVATAGQPLVAEAETGVPWLKDVPLLGWLFRSTQEIRMRRHLLVAMQAVAETPESRELARALALELESLESEEVR